jgi:hypothetical protein
VIGAAGKLVSKGEEPMALAGVLADMPDQPGEALQSWVGQLAQKFAVTAAKVDAAHVVARHQLGVSAVHGLLAQATNSPRPMNPASSAPALNPAQGNALMNLTPAGNA